MWTIIAIVIIGVCIKCVVTIIKNWQKELHKALYIKCIDVDFNHYKVVQEGTRFYPKFKKIPNYNELFYLRNESGNTVNFDTPNQALSFIKEYIYILETDPNHRWVIVNTPVSNNIPFLF